MISQSRLIAACNVGLRLLDQRRIIAARNFGAAILALVAILGGTSACGTPSPSASQAASPAMSAMPSMATGGTADPNSVFPSSPPTAADHVTIQNFAFVPAVVTVKAGTTVTWTNQDEEPHTVTFVGAPGAKSPPLQLGETFTYTFGSSGSFAYLCSIHPQMHGGVVVTSA